MFVFFEGLPLCFLFGYELVEVNYGLKQASYLLFRASWLIFLFFPPFETEFPQYFFLFS
jgi:hypothetical protein